MARDEPDRWWVGYPWRLIQTNLREVDMADMDAAEYVRQLQSFHATVAMINTGGIIASYPTRLADHHPSSFLSGDSLEAVISACHEAGIRVIARNDFSKIRRPVYERHPDWAYRTVDGRIVDYNGDVHTCLNGDYQQRYAREIIAEIVTTLDVDGVFFNMGGFQVRDYSYVYHGPCHCAACRRRFRDECGMDLPTADGAGRAADANASAAAKEAARAYDLATARWVAEHEESIYRLIKELRPDVAVDHYDFQRQESNTEIGRPLPRWQYDASSNARWVRTSMPGTISSSTSVDFIGFPYRHVAVSPAQQELRLWQNLANGGALDYYLIGRLDNHRDRSGFTRIRDVFDFHRRNESVYEALDSVADVLVVRPSGGLTDEARGWIRLLTEGHFLFDEAALGLLHRVDLSSYGCIVLPEVARLGDEDAARLDRFTAAGGTLVATGTTAFADANLEPRETPGLEALGIEAVEAVRTDMRSALFEVPAGSRRLLPETDLVMFGDTYVYARYAPAARLQLRLIPPHPWGPPERCSYTQVTDRPGLVVHPYGRGRAIFFPWLPGELFYREGYVNTSSFVQDVLCADAGLSPLQTDAGPMAEITVQRCRSDASVRIVSIINASGHYATTYYDPVPLMDVHITVPAAGEPERVQSLRDGRAISHRYADGLLTVILDIRGIGEVVMIRGHA